MYVMVYLKGDGSMRSELRKNRNKKRVDRNHKLHPCIIISTATAVNAIPNPNLIEFYKDLMSKLVPQPQELVA